MSQHNSAKGKIIGAVVLIVIVAVAAWWYFTRMPGLDFSRQGPPPSSEPAPASTAPLPIEHPIEQAQTVPAPASTAPLPPLGDSDDVATKALAAIPGAEGLAGLLLSRGLIPHLVATVDALPRKTIGSSILPLRPPSGAIVVDAADGKTTLGTANYARYEPYMKIVEAVDARTLVSWYVHWYPLFQQAYRELGYPSGYFNDRLMVAINDMLAAPNARPPVALVKTVDGHYAFADPTWESLSVGQKLMIRIGPQHERELKAKLRSVRALLLGKAPTFNGGASAASASSAEAPAASR